MGPGTAFAMRWAPGLGAGALAAGLLLACGRDPGWEAAIEGGRKPDSILEAGARAEREARRGLRRSGATHEAEPDKRILFGDLHVHTSYSWDGFLFSLPLVGGEGAHPPNDACDFARYCANLDFYALTDHAESLLAEHWEASKQSVRQCNALAGRSDDPDLVAFMGFEWSQAGLTPETHFGHRCVVFRDSADDRLPLRPISSADTSDLLLELRDLIRGVRWLAPQVWNRHTSYVEYLGALTSRPICPEGVDPRSLPGDCHEIAPTPRELREKLDQWGFEALAIPHGTAWGTYTPATATLDEHLAPENFDAERNRLIEIFSGHGAVEEYRSWREFEIGPDGEHICPEPTPDYLPCCWQAGEIMRSRCGELSEEECERRVALARRYAAAVYLRPHNVFPDAAPEEWLDCGQCRDCFKPAFGYRPRESVEYAMALSRDDPSAPDGAPLRFRYGFVSSSDGHSGRPGTGYKQLEPTVMSDLRGSPDFPFRHLAFLGRGEMDDPLQPQLARQRRIGVRGSDVRVSSFLYPGGLAAVHARGRGREAIWEALQRREVYATSGPRILLWFDLLNGESGPAPMGSEHELSEAPRFEVRAVGSFEQRPGCPETSWQGLGRERLELLCRGECHYPSDLRRPIEAIEVVRIRPRGSPGEPVGALIEDPWLRLRCDPSPAGCVVRFEDPEFAASGRDALYYVRALEAPSPALNGAPLSTEFDERGDAVHTTLCLTSKIDRGGCPAPVRERAWSSPIFVDQLRGAS